MHSSEEMTTRNGLALLRIEDAKEEDEEDESGGMEDWERAYAEERSWEDLHEDESGLLRSADPAGIHLAQYRRRVKAYSSAERIQKGLIRYLYVIVDLSRVSSL